MAVEAGYKSVFVYNDGIPGWAKAGYPLVSKASYPETDVPLVSAQDLAKMDKGALVLVDTRPVDEFQKGHIPESENIDLDNLHETYSSLPKDKKIVLIDHKGKTNLVAGRFLASKGYSNVLRLDGGFNAWAKAGTLAGK